MPRKAFITWSRPFDVEKAVDVRPAVATDHYGIYMIVEENTKTAKKLLIYIGIVWSETRDLMIRLQEHRKDWLVAEKNERVYVKFGVIETTSKLDRQFIEDAESVLIFGAGPRENSKKKSSYTLYEDIVVHNKGQGVYLAKQYDSALQRKIGA